MSHTATMGDSRKSVNCLRRDTAAFLFALCITVLTALVGYSSVPLITPDGCSVSLLPVNLYADCETVTAVILRFTVLSRPILVQTALVWLSAYVHFEKALSGFMFAVRGVSLGVAIHVLFDLPDSAAFAPLVVAYTAITVILLLLVRCIRKESGARPAGESFICALIAAGAALCVCIAVSLLYYIDF